MRTWKKTLELGKLEGMGALFSIRLLGFLPHPLIPKLLTAKIWLPLFTQKCDTAVLRCLFNPFQLLIPLKSQEDLDKAMEQLELSPSLKSLRILVSTPKKANVSPSPSLLFCVQSEMPCYCVRSGNKSPDSAEQRASWSGGGLALLWLSSSEILLRWQPGD